MRCFVVALISPTQFSNARNSTRTRRMHISKRRNEFSDTFKALRPLALFMAVTSQLLSWAIATRIMRQMATGNQFQGMFSPSLVPLFLGKQKKQTTVAQSTVESEYAAMAHAAKEMVWLQYLLKDLGMSKYAPTTILCDNQGAISLAKNPTHHAKTKHVDVQLHFIRDHIEKGTIKVEYCPTEDMLADIMTKGLARERHAQLMGMMGMGVCGGTTSTPPSFEDDYQTRQKDGQH